MNPQKQVWKKMRFTAIGSTTLKIEGDIVHKLLYRCSSNYEIEII